MNVVMPRPEGWPSKFERRSRLAIVVLAGSCWIAGIAETSIAGVEALTVLSAMSEVRIANRT